MTVSTPSTRPRHRIIAAPVSTETNSTCRISPFAKASTRVLGMMLRKNFTAVNPPAAAVALVTPAETVRLVACRPTPGWTTLTRMKPRTRPTVLTTSKYSSDFQPSRPSLPMSLTWARPSTTVVKMIGASIIRSSAMNPSPSGFMSAARPGSTMPSTMASAMPTSTCTQSGLSALMRISPSCRHRPRSPCP
jgi:hypothetical protein